MHRLQTTATKSWGIISLLARRSTQRTTASLVTKLDGCNSRTICITSCKASWFEYRMGCTSTYYGVLSQSQRQFLMNSFQHFNGSDRQQQPIISCRHNFSTQHQHYQQLSTKPLEEHNQTVSDHDTTKPAKEAPKLDCDRADVIFANRTNTQLLRGLFAFQCCSHDVIVRNSNKLMKLGQGILGERLFASLMKATIYGHFVAGEEGDAIDCLARELAKVGVSGLVSEMLEEDVGERTERIHEDMYEGNAKKIIASYDKQLLVSKHMWYPPVNTEKVTAVANAGILEKVSTHWRDADMVLENDSPVCVQNMLDGLNGKLQPVPCLTTEGNQHLQNALTRLDNMARVAVDKGVQLFIDAERHNIQPAIKMIAVAMMWKYNQDKPWVWSTYQAYLKGSLDEMKKDVRFLEDKKVCFGAKIVRGAYLEHEKAVQQKTGADYLRPNFDATSDSYHVLMDYGLSLVKDWGVKRCNIILATQNEKSAQRGVDRMWVLGIPAESGSVLFAQQLGMADHVSVALGQAGYPVYKLFPCGSVAETIPYMTRRAQENHSVFKRIGKEKRMMRQELFSRLFRKE